MYREETAQERAHQDRVDRAHVRMRKQLLQLASELTWFEGEGAHGPLTDDMVFTYLKRRDQACGA